MGVSILRKGNAMPDSPRFPYGEEDEILNVRVCLKVMKVFLDQERIDNLEQARDNIEIIDFLQDCAMKAVEAAIKAGKARAFPTQTINKADPSAP